MPPNWNGLLFLEASIGTSRAEHTTFYMPYQQIETLLSLTKRQFLQWKFIISIYHIQEINLNLRRRCGQTEIVCHRSLLMSLALAEQSIQLLICHISRWRLCHCSPQDNEFKSWEKLYLWCCCNWGWCLWHLGQFIAMYIRLGISSKA